MGEWKSEEKYPEGPRLPTSVCVEDGKETGEDHSQWKGPTVLDLVHG